MDIYRCSNLLMPEITFGVGAKDRLADVLSGWAIGEALIVTDRGLAKAGIVDQIVGVVGRSGCRCQVFDGVEQDPEVSVAERSLEFARSHHPQVIIGLGGGSPLDIAKVTAALLASDRPISQYFGFNKIEKKGVRTVLIPTTAGTGTEVAVGAVLSDSTNRLKRGILSPYLMCDAAILDPELTVSCPSSITASSGLDALIHAIEAYTNLKALRLVDPLLLDAIRMIYVNLPLVHQDGTNLVARGEMLLASMYAGIGMQVVNNAAVHALSSPFSAFYNVPHGVANSILLPYVMEFNRCCCINKYARIAEAFGLGGSADDEKKASAAVAAVKELTRLLRIREQVTGLKVRTEDLTKMAELSLRVWLMANNPREIRQEDALMIYQTAFREEQVALVN